MKREVAEGGRSSTLLDIAAATVQNSKMQISHVRFTTFLGQSAPSSTAPPSSLI